MKKEPIQMGFEFGDIFTIINKAKKISEENGDNDVATEFNGVNLLINSKTDHALLWRDIQTAWLMDWKTVGPTPLSEYPPALLETIKAKENEREERAKVQQAERAAKDKREREAYETKVAGQVLTLINQSEWDMGLSKNSDGYGRTVFEYAEGWGKLMQCEMDHGAVLEDIASKTSFELGFLGISGFQYGAAVSVLSQCWAHGERLKKWHNKSYGNSEAEGVINPAVLSLKNK